MIAMLLNLLMSRRRSAICDCVVFVVEIVAIHLNVFLNIRLDLLLF